MDSLTYAVLTAQVLGSLLVAVLLGLLCRSYQRPFLQYWAYGWAALAVYSASGLVGIRLSAFVGPSHPARLIQSFVAVAAGLEASVWLLFGAFALPPGRAWSPRAAFRLSLAACLVAAVVTVGTLGLPGMLRYGIRVSLLEFVFAIALTVAASRVWRIPTRQRLAGRRLLALALTLFGLEQLRFAVDGIGQYLLGSRYPDLRIVGVADFFIQATIGLALVIWLLEDESDRLETSLRQEGRALDALLQSEARQRAVLDNIDEIVYIVHHPADRARRSLEFVSATVSEVLGHPPEAFSADPNHGYSFVHPDDAAALVARTREILSSLAAGTREYRLRDQNGEYHWIEDRIAPYIQESGQIAAFFGVARDVSDRKRAEQALRDTEEQYRQAQKMEAVGRLAGGIAHDFNNLLMAISGHNEILLDMFGPADERRREAQEIAKAASRATDLTRQLLAFGRGDAIEPRALDLNVVVVGLQRMLDRLIPATIHLTTALDPGIGRVWADHGQVERVIVNLVVNARDALAAGGTIRIATREVDGASVPSALLTDGPLGSGAYVELSVHDNGSGIDPELRPHIFEPFFTTKESGKGTGLGLSIVYSLVRQSGGAVGLESGPDGTTFRLYFPRGEAAPEGAVAAPHGSGMVLVVDEEDAVRGLVARVLMRHGYDVVEARGRAEAIRLVGASDVPIDLAIIDCGTLEDSVALARELERAQPTISVVYFAASDDDTGTSAAEPRLRKPFKPDTLVRVVAQALSEKSTTKSSGR